VFDTYATFQDTPLPSTSTRSVLLNDYTSSTPGVVTATLIASTSNGMVTLNANGTFVYTSTPGFLGTDAFGYRLRIGDTSYGIATTTIDVVADPRPRALDDEFVVTTNADSLVVASASGVLVNDPKNTDLSLTAVKVANPSNGTLTFNSNGSFTYTRNTGFTGTDTFTYRVVSPFLSDTGSTDPADPDVATVTIRVVEPITAGADEYLALAGLELSTTASTGVLRNDRDPAGEEMTAVLVSNVSNGALSLNANGSFTYTASSTFSGVDTFTYRARNASLTESAVQTTTLRVSMNPKPRAGNDYYDYNQYTLEGTARTVTSTLGVLLNDVDHLNGFLTAVKVTDPANGVVTVNAEGSFTYTPNAEFDGTDSFTYKAVRFGDGNLESDPATVTIRVYVSTPAKRLLPKYGLTVTKPGFGSGVVTSTGNVINCGGDCTGSFFPEFIELRATTAPGSTFAGWGGICEDAGTSTRCFLSVGTTSTASATFNVIPPVPASSAWSLGLLAVGLGMGATFVLWRLRSKQQPS